MKKIRLFPFLLLSGLVMMACGGEGDASTSETEESNETVETTDPNSSEDEMVQIVEDLDNATFKQYWEEKGGLLIDLRTPEEVANGTIAGSINIDYNAGDFDAAIDTLDTSTPVFVYCQGGGRSGNARDQLKEKGFLEVYNLKNGYGNWQE